MKKIISIFLITFSIVATNAQTFTKLTNFPDPDAFCTWVFATSVNDAYVTVFGTNSLYTTHDGGQTWNSIVLGPDTYELTDVYFTDPMNGWVCGSIEATGVGVLFKTTDGGLTWQDVSANIPSRATASFSAVRFNGLNGVLGSNRGNINTNNNFSIFYTTNDGGVTWTQHNTFTGAPTFGEIEITRISNNPVSGTFELAARYNGITNFILSIDQNFNSQVVFSESTGGFNEKIPFDIFNVNGTVYLFTTTEPFKSTDGINYTPFQYPVLNPSGSRILSGFFDTPDKGYIVGDNAAIYKTEDGGNTWTTLQHVNSGPNITLRNVFKFQNVIWAVGQDGAVYRSQDASLSTNNDFITGKEVKIYPNPTADNIVIDGADSDKIQVYTVSGRDVTSVTGVNRLSEDKVKVDLSNLKPGLYIIQAGNRSHKVLKK